MATLSKKWRRRVLIHARPDSRPEWGAPRHLAPFATTVRFLALASWPSVNAALYGVRWRDAVVAVPTVPEEYKLDLGSEFSWRSTPSYVVLPPIIASRSVSLSQLEDLFRRCFAYKRPSLLRLHVRSLEVRLQNELGPKFMGRDAPSALAGRETAPPHRDRRSDLAAQGIGDSNARTANVCAFAKHGARIVLDPRLELLDAQLALQAKHGPKPSVLIATC